MSNNYPYYVATFMDGETLRKIFNDTKFKTYNKCVTATKDRYERFSKLWNGKNPFYENQIAILEYTATYQGRIVTLFTNGNEVNISTPKVYE